MNYRISIRFSLTTVAVSNVVIFHFVIPEIPIFGVLTGCDKAKDRYKQAEEGFLAALGIPRTRYIGCTNYCDDYAAAKDVSLRQASFPELDVPVIRFMQEVCDDNSVLRECYC